jgi:hypothetical protein
MADEKGSTLELTEEDGCQLAVNMLVEMEQIGFDELVIDGEKYREGRPQNDLLTRYLTPRAAGGFG